MATVGDTIDISWKSRFEMHLDSALVCKCFSNCHHFVVLIVQNRCGYLAK